MKRRNFLKYASTLAATRAMPIGLGVSVMAKQAQAFSPAYSALNVVAPSVMPQVINIHMYGGASELAGNLSNISDIDVNSVNSYSGAFGDRILRTQAEAEADDGINDDSWEVTANNFWRSAGGTHMEEMLASSDMAVYRTIYKQKSPTRSHRESIFMAHKGTIDVESSPGIGSRLALMMMNHEGTFSGAKLADGTVVGSLDELTLPFVSFEGDSVTYALDPSNTIPLHLRGLSMDSQFNNPYTRGSINTNSEDAISAMVSARKLVVAGDRDKQSGAWNGFEKRAELEAKMTDLSELLDGTDENGNLSSAAALGVTYPNNNGFADQLEAAITLALHNPQTLYMAVGTPGIGGWDDHNNGIDNYPNRMNQLMEALKAAMAHIKAAAAQGVTTISGTARTQTDNIVINVLGDFGRLVNLNNSGGWDHANNQNLYTFGGAGVRPTKEAAALGTVVGSTVRSGTSKTNNQYTLPDTEGGSPTWEPMSIASSIYGYFGVQDSKVMTADPALNPDGDVRLEDKL